MGWNPPSLSQTEIWILLTFTHISIHICYTYFRSWEHGALNVSGSTVWCYYRWRIRRCLTVNMMEIWNLHLFWLGKKKLININTNLLHSQGRHVSVKSRGLAPCRKWSRGKTTMANYCFDWWWGVTCTESTTAAEIWKHFSIAVWTSTTAEEDHGNVKVTKRKS